MFVSLFLFLSLGVHMLLLNSAFDAIWHITLYTYACVCLTRKWNSYTLSLSLCLLRCVAIWWSIWYRVHWRHFDCFDAIYTIDIDFWWASVACCTPKHECSNNQLQCIVYNGICLNQKLHSASQRIPSARRKVFFHLSVAFAMTMCHFPFYKIFINYAAVTLHFLHLTNRVWPFSLYIFTQK